jgi:hypothetical protein
MSITMSMRLATDADARRWRNDPSAVERATMARVMMDAESLDVAAKAMADMASNAQSYRPRGVAEWLMQKLMGRAIQASLKKQAEQLEQMRAALAAPPGSPERAEFPEPGRVIDLHKSWQVLHEPRSRLRWPWYVAIGGPTDRTRSEGRRSQG